MRSITAALRAILARVRGFSSADYWEHRYRKGGNSGPGSYSHLARFKADVLNRFVHENGVSSVIEFGCGDGHQLDLAQYPSYVGYDVSPTAVAICRERFGNDASRQFFEASDYDGRVADLALSLDVLFHLTEDAVFEQYMRLLFAASTRFVIIYSSDQDEQFEPTSIHVRHRCFTRWVERELPREWKLIEKIPNAFPYNGDYRET